MRWHIKRLSLGTGEVENPPGHLSAHLPGSILHFRNIFFQYHSRRKALDRNFSGAPLLYSKDAFSFVSRSSTTSPDRSHQKNRRDAQCLPAFLTQRVSDGSQGVALRRYILPTQRVADSNTGNFQDIRGKRFGCNNRVARLLGLLRLRSFPGVFVPSSLRHPGYYM